MPSLTHRAPSADAAGQRHDIAAFEALFRAHYAPLCDYVYGYVRSRAVAQELVQDLFLRLWELAPTTAATLGASYLYTAARNRALGHGLCRHTGTDGGGADLARRLSPWGEPLEAVRELRAIVSFVRELCHQQRKRLGVPSDP